MISGAYDGHADSASGYEVVYTTFNRILYLATQAAMPVMVAESVRSCRLAVAAARLARISAQIEKWSRQA